MFFSVLCDAAETAGKPTPRRSFLRMVCEMMTFVFGVMSVSSGCMCMCFEAKYLSVSLKEYVIVFISRIYTRADLNITRLNNTTTGIRV